MKTLLAIIKGMRQKQKILIGIVALGILVAALLFFIFYHPLPNDFKNATYVGFNQTSYQTQAYQHSRNALAPVSIPGTTVSIAAAHNGYATITQNGTFFTISLNGREIASPTTTPENVSVSPDGRWIGFSLSRNLATSTFPIITESSVGMGDPAWKAVLVDTSAPKLTLQSLDLGFSPVFTDSTHVVWISPRGLTGMDLKTGNETLLASLAMGSAQSPLLVSPDGKHVAFYDLTKNAVQIYNVTPTTATLAASIPTDKKHPAISYTLGTSVLYSVHIINDNTQIWSTPLTGGASKVIESIPGSYRVSQLIIPSAL